MNPVPYFTHHENLVSPKLEVGAGWLVECHHDSLMFWREEGIDSGGAVFLSLPQIARPRARVSPP